MDWHTEPQIGEDELDWIEESPFPIAPLCAEPPMPSEVVYIPAEVGDPDTQVAFCIEADLRHPPQEPPWDDEYGFCHPSILEAIRLDSLKEPVMCVW